MITVALTALMLSAPVTASPQTRVTPVVKAIKRVSPAVICIYATHYAQNPFAGGLPPFLGPMPGVMRGRSIGSGVIFDPRGYAVTNAHVVHAAVDLKVKLSDGREFPAKVIGTDERVDVAVIKIRTKEKLPYASFGSSSDLLLGETVIAIGNPFGLTFTVSKGIISALHRDFPLKGGRYILDNVIQTDAAINPGNSGGPLVNILGQVVGLNFAMRRASQGIGFAIPIDTVKQVVKEVLRYGQVRGSWLGMSVQEDEHGVRVVRVYPKSPAWKAGIRVGQYLRRFGSRDIKSLRDFVRVLGTLVPGQKVQVRTNTGRHTVKVAAITPKMALRRFEDRFGVKLDSVRKLPAKFRHNLHPGAVIVSLDTSGMAYSMGLRPLDVITSVNGKPVARLSDLSKLLSFVPSGGSIYITVWRSGRQYPLVIPY